MGEYQMGRKLYVSEDDNNSIFILWNEHADTEISPGNTIVIKSGLTVMGSNEATQVEAISDSEVLINPDEDDLKSIDTTELYMASSWSRPSGTSVMFEYAKSSRAKCKVCGVKIDKGNLKVVKPIWTKDEKTGRTFAGNNSLHLNCAIDDDHGVDVLHEAITRLTPDLIIENKIILLKLYKNLPDIKSKQILGKLLK